MNRKYIARLLLIITACAAFLILQSPFDVFVKLTEGQAVIILSIGLLSGWTAASIISKGTTGGD